MSRPKPHSSSRQGKISNLPHSLSLPQLSSLLLDSHSLAQQLSITLAHSYLSSLSLITAFPHSRSLSLYNYNMLGKLELTTKMLQACFTLLKSTNINLFLVVEQDCSASGKGV
ncbi:hypothetical protein V8G54_023130 [Vigna mungo]|uniref:Uncharacterized protein n=1 Tax=Vigna mungo TaxID=3915 RepID=A0AAQ3N3N4_VIGMU